MLQNLPRPIPLVLTKMEQSDFIFYLTGDRFWGYVGSKHLWEFFTEDSPEVQQWLAENKFVLCNKGDLDIDYMNYTKIYIFHNLMGSPIRIYLVESAYVKNKIQSELYKLCITTINDKEYTTKVWKNAYAIYELGGKFGGKNKLTAKDDHDYYPQS